MFLQTTKGVSKAANLGSRCFLFYLIIAPTKKEKVIALIIFDACSANGLSAKIGDYFVMKLAIFLCQRVPE